MEYFSSITTVRRRTDQKSEFILGKLYKYKPAVTKNFLLFLAGIVWVFVGLMLLFLAFSWLSTASNSTTFLFTSAGVVLALFVHHFGFLKIADKNLKRILLMNEKKCLFAFIPWKSYLIIALMITMGIALRHSAIPKRYLAILYICIGMGLILSSVRYIRVLIREIRR
jgi:hypothetical protein